MEAIPDDEMIIWEDDELRASLERAREDVAAGHIMPAGDFSAYLDKDV